MGLDFYRKVGAHYGTLEQWVFEPSVALKIIEDYASHPGITVVKNHHICSVSKEGTAIRSISVADGADTLSFSVVMKVTCLLWQESHIMLEEKITLSMEKHGTVYNS